MYLKKIYQKLVCLCLCCYLMSASYAFDMPPSPVSVVPAKAITWQPSIKETGSLIAPQGILVASEVDGRITQIYFHSGQMVKKDDPLIELNQDVIKAQLAADQAKLNLAQLAYNRARGLNAKKYISQADFDQLETNFHAAQAKVAQSQAMFNQTLIKAPFGGQLGLNKVSIGDYIRAGQGLVNLQTIKPIYVNFNVPEKYLSKIHKEQTVNLSTTAYPGQVFQGKVFAFESLIDVNTRTLGARASIPNEDGRLLPGAFVEVELLLGEPQSIISIPQIALVTKDAVSNESGDWVYVVKNKQAILTQVKVLARQHNDVLIGQGLAAGDLVVTEGQIKLHDKAPVAVP